MSVEFIEGDMFANKHRVKAFAHGVNCIGVMGGGIAAEFARRYPVMLSEYKRQCQCSPRLLNPGDVLMWKEPRLPWVFNLATQDTLVGAQGGGARLPWIAQSLAKMIVLAELDDVDSIALPQIGAGLGGLEWEPIKAIIEHVGEKYDGRLVVYEKYVPEVDSAPKSLWTPRKPEVSSIDFYRGAAQQSMFDDRVGYHGRNYYTGSSGARTKSDRAPWQSEPDQVELTLVNNYALSNVTDDQVRAVIRSGIELTTATLPELLGIMEDAGYPYEDGSVDDSEIMDAEDVAAYLNDEYGIVVTGEWADRLVQRGVNITSADDVMQVLQEMQAEEEAGQWQDEEDRGSTPRRDGTNWSNTRDGSIQSSRDTDRPTGNPMRSREMRRHFAHRGKMKPSARPRWIK